MNRFREWYNKMMIGRYGADQFSRFLMYAVLVLLVLSLFIRNGAIDLVVIILIGYSYFRMFSKNHSARYQENQWYLKTTADIRRKISSFINVNRQRKDFHIYTCPNPQCRQKIRIPKGKGHIQITCPKCRTQFMKNS